MGTISAILLVTWMLGSVSSYTMGGFLHMFLVAAIALMMPRVIWGRKGAR